MQFFIAGQHVIDKLESELQLDTSLLDVAGTLSDDICMVNVS
jgi:hypothetical protein